MTVFFNDKDERKEEDGELQQQEAPNESEDNNEGPCKTGMQQIKETINDQGRVLRNRAMLHRPVRYETDVAEYITPNTYEEAIQSDYAAQWMQAIEEELQAHKTNNTWLIVQKTPGIKIDSKWVFKIKDDPTKKTQRFKARLCAVLCSNKESTLLKHSRLLCDTTHSEHS